MAPCWASLGGYQASNGFTSLAERTRQDYKKQIILIECEYSDFPLKAVSDRRSRGEFMEWRDRLAA